jgi:hypothetical protein
MNRPQVPLAQLLRVAAVNLAVLEPPPWRPPPALTEVPRPPARRWLWPAAWSGAAACALVVLVSALLMLQGPPNATDALPLQASASDFLPVAAPERWDRLGREGQDAAWLVTTEMPRDRLAALGLPYDPARAGENVRAELLMHPSGEVLAVRFLR